mgnify:CR=1 FL=1
MSEKLHMLELRMSPECGGMSYLLARYRNSAGNEMNE